MPFWDMSTCRPSGSNGIPGKLISPVIWPSGAAKRTGHLLYPLDFEAEASRYASVLSYC